MTEQQGRRSSFTHGRTAIAATPEPVAPTEGAAKGKRAATRKDKPAKAPRGKKTDGGIKVKEVQHEGETFHVPVPGGKLAGDRRMAVRTRNSLIVGGTILALGAITGGTALGIATVNANRTTDITPEDAGRYRLTTWPVDSGAAFAERYLRHCLARSADAPYNEWRSEAVEAMTASTPDPACTASSSPTDGTPSSTDPVVRTVTSAAFTGGLAEVPGYPSARYLSIEVAFSTSSKPIIYTVPVSFDDPATATGPRIIGDIAPTPVEVLGTPTRSKGQESPVVDSDLSDELKSGVVATFLTDWFASDEARLSTAAAADAAPVVTTGLGGLYTDVKVTSVAALPPAEALPEGGGSDATPEYVEGMKVPVVVGASFTDPTTKTVESGTWRLTLEFTGDGKWLVANVEGGAMGELPEAERK